MRTAIDTLLSRSPDGCGGHMGIDGIPLNRQFLTGGAKVKLTERVIYGMLFGCLICLATTPALAQNRGGAVTLRYTSFSPIVALLAGILILILPRLLNYIVAIYLIAIGLLG